MTLIGFELKKIVQNPVAWAVLVIVLALNTVTVLRGDPGTSYSEKFPVSVSKLREIQEKDAYFAGPITREWIDRYRAEDEAILQDPKYLVSQEEAERIVQLYTLQYGYTEEKVRSMTMLFLNEAGQAEHDRYEGAAVASDFYVNAESFGQSMAAYYLERYPGRAGTRMADYTLARYGALAQGHTVNYNYFLGYQKVRRVLENYPYTVGLVILAALAPLFSGEHSRGTAALLLCSKHGRGKLARSKLAAGLITALAAWGLVTGTTLGLVFPIYGTVGREAFWQDWLYAVAPFPWDQGQATLISLLTSLFGALYLALTVMLISAALKSQFASLAAGGALLLFPTLDFTFDGVYAVDMLYNLLPSRLLMGEHIWQGYDLFYLAGCVVPYQYAVIAVSVAACVGAGLATARVFGGRYPLKHGMTRQLKNNRAGY